MGVLSAGMYVCVPCVTSVQGVQKKVLGPPELESVAVVSHQDGAGSWSSTGADQLPLQPHFLS